MTAPFYSFMRHSMLTKQALSLHFVSSCAESPTTFNDDTQLCHISALRLIFKYIPVQAYYPINQRNVSTQNHIILENSSQIYDVCCYVSQKNTV